MSHKRRFMRHKDLDFGPGYSIYPNTRLTTVQRPRRQSVCCVDQWASGWTWSGPARSRWPGKWSIVSEQEPSSDDAVYRIADRRRRGSALNVDDLRSWINPVGRDSRSTFEEMAARFSPSEEWLRVGFATVFFNGKYGSGFYVLTDLGVHFQATTRTGPLGRRTQAICVPWAQVNDVTTGVSRISRDVSFFIGHGQKVTLSWTIHSGDISPSPAEEQQEGFLAAYQSMSRSSAPSSRVLGTPAGPPDEWDWGPPSHVRRTPVSYVDAYAKCTHEPECMFCDRWVAGGLGDDYSKGSLGELARKAAAKLALTGHDQPLSVLEPGMGSAPQGSETAAACHWWTPEMGPAPQGSGWLIFEIEHWMDREGNPEDPYVVTHFWQVRLLEDGTLVSADWQMRQFRSGKIDNFSFSIGQPGRMNSFSVDYWIDCEGHSWNTTEEIPSIKSWEGRVPAGAYARDGRKDPPVHRVNGYGLASLLQSIIDPSATSGT